MFVVVESGGDWEDKWSSVSVCSTDRTKLEAYIVEQQANRERRRDIQERLSVLYKETVEKFPKRVGTLSKKERKHWAPGLGQNQITQEMRDERKATEAHNNAMFKEQEDILLEWLEGVWYPIYRQFLLDNGRKVPDVIVYGESMGGGYIQEVDYEIEEIKEL